MLAITRSFHIFFYPAVCAHVHSITCYHLKLFILIICKSHCTVQLCITNKLHDYIAWSHLMLCCGFRSYNFVPHNYIHCITLYEPVYFTYINMICSQYFLLPQLASPPLLVPYTKMVYNTTSYLDKHICKQMSIILFLTDVSFLQNYIVPNNLFFSGCMAASTPCILSVVS